MAEHYHTAMTYVRHPEGDETEVFEQEDPAWLWVDQREAVEGFDVKRVNDRTALRHVELRDEEGLAIVLKLWSCTVVLQGGRPYLSCRSV